jgi:hypothetical protein
MIRGVYEENPLEGRCFQYLSEMEGVYVMSKSVRGIEWGMR